jgi:alpha-L-fucosidase 2
MNSHTLARVLRCLRLLAFLAAACLASPSHAAPGPMELFSTTAATYSTQTSNDAYPIGNGKLAAMIYGGVAQEIIQFNEDTVWAGQVHDYSHTGAVNSLAAIRNYVWAGQGTNAYTAAASTFMSVPLRQSPYNPTANLRLNFAHPSPTGYRRSLDLTTALAKVEYVNAGVTYTREYFASFPDKVIVTRISASQAGALGFNYTFDSQHTACTVSTSGTDLIIDGKVNKDANTARQQTSDIMFRARIKIQTDGGTVTASGTTITVSGATSATLIMSVATNFVKYNDLTADPVARTTTILSTAGAKTYTQLRDTHLADYQPLFQRVELDLNSTNQSSLATDARLKKIRDAGLAGGSGTAQHAPGAAALAQDLQFVALNFQMARYLYIAGSRPGSQPLTLQGKWNNELDPAWESKMTVNINQEMNYWGVEVMNLPECDLPMVELVRDLSQSGAIVATKHYGSTGWVVHHNTDLWRGAAPINGADGIWTTGGAWLSQHLWWHYLYTGDKTYLADAYPLMKGAAQFFVDTLVQGQGAARAPYLMTNPGFSPEWAQPVLDNAGGGTTVAGVTMDNELVRALFNYVIQASQVLDVDSDFRTLITTKRNLLPPNKIGSKGQLQEWFEDVDVANTHRHLSPLVAMFPGDEISPNYEPAMAAACKVHLDWKGDDTNNTSWSQAHKMCLRNTLFDGNKGFTIMANLLRTSHANNLTFSVKGTENQIDGNLGSAMGIAMFFLQNTRGEIQLLPALPSNIPQGSVKGLRSPGAFTVGLTWASSLLTSGTIHSDLGNPCRVRIATPIHVMKGNRLIPLTTIATNLYEFPTIAAGDYTILPGAVSATDTDGDGIPDAFETNTGVFVSATNTGSSPILADTDGDSLNDGDEVYLHGTNPNLADTDGDGLRDAVEIALAGMGLDPLQNSSAWLALLVQNGPPLGLFTREQLLSSETGERLIQRPVGGAFIVKVKVERSEDLITWSALDLQTEATFTQNAAGFHFALASSLPKEFYRFTLRDVFVSTSPVLSAVNPADTDGDQIPDVIETNLAALGFAVGANSSALRQQLLDHAGELGLFTENAVRVLSIEGPADFEKTAGSTVSFDLEVTLENAAGGWGPAIFQAGDVSLTGAELQLRFPSDPALEYYRLIPSP